MNHGSAILADINGDFTHAAELYEEAIASGAADLEMILNLALLYWQATDPGIAAARQLSPSFMERASRRLPTLLAEAERQFPQSSGPRFWKRYIAWADLNEPLSIDYCLDLLKSDPTDLSPALYVYTASGGKLARGEAARLLSAVDQRATAAGRYIQSVLRSMMPQA